MASLQQSLLAFLLLSFGLRAHADHNEQQRVPNFPSCVTDCIEGSGCDAADLKCICRASRGSFLPSVAVCMHNKCTQPVSVDLLLNPLEFACNGLGQPIPPAAISSAEAAQSSVSNAKPSATVAPQTTAKTGSAQTASAAASKTTTPVPESTSCTSTLVESEPGASTSLQNSEGVGVTTTTAPVPEPSTEVHFSFDASTQSVSSSATTTTTAGPVDPTDSSPFATPINSGAYHRQCALSGIVISLVAAIAFGW